VEAGDLTIWSLQIFETNTFDVISRDDVPDRAQVLVRREHLSSHPKKSRGVLRGFSRVRLCRLPQ
jgi:hypothetical protein